MEVSPDLVEVTPVTTEVSPVYFCACSAVICGPIFTRRACTVTVVAAIVTLRAERVQIFARKATRSNRAVHV